MVVYVDVLGQVFCYILCCCFSLKSGWFRKADHEGAAQAYGNAGEMVEMCERLN